MPRLFTGLEVPYHVQSALWLKRGGLSGARWIDPENYHITLRFIGDVDNRTADEVSYELDRLSYSEGFGIRLSHSGTFGGDTPRALYAGGENSEGLQRLQAAHERVLRRAGLEPEARRFVPHVSLARLRGASAVEVAEFIHEAGQFTPLEFSVGRFVLFSSKASVGGGPYLVEQTYPLAALSAPADFTLRVS
ncbi:MAG TPA: RNA 2',3'-cyclic phosphodiesterase [Devosia sp.]|nr:RNA 2',3'-cyclic phosphodiesterase [Devosia sp.]